MKKQKSKLARKKRKHDKLVNDYDNQKSKHLEKLADKTLRNLKICFKNKTLKSQKQSLKLL
jgi:hypothetical protein